jgi:hypothetical protein
MLGNFPHFLYHFLMEIANPINSFFQVFDMSLNLIAFLHDLLKLFSNPPRDVAHFSPALYLSTQHND